VCILYCDAGGRTEEVKLGLVCPRCDSNIRPTRKEPMELRQYRLRGYECIACRKKMVVATFIATGQMAKWLGRIYEEDTEDPEDAGL